MNELFYLSGLEIAKKIKSKEVSPLEVAKSHIDRAIQANKEINAIAEDNFAGALKMAEAQTQELSKLTNLDHLPPYFGVPFTIKEIIAFKNFHQTAGDIHYKSSISHYNATVIKRMINAGAIPLATTNIPELGLWFECYNPVYGKTLNPYDKSRTPGGSSGGEGALIGSGASPMGIGSDIGGSIRIPASFCGVFGHKPTNKMVPITGHFPHSLEQLKNHLTGDNYPYLSLGPLSRKSEDLYVLLEIMMGPDEYDPEVKTQPALRKKTFEWKGKKIWILPSPHFHLARSTNEECEESVKKVGRYFSALDADVEELNPRLMIHGVELWLKAIKSTQSVSFKKLLNPTGDIHFFSEIFKLIRGHSSYTLPSLLLSQLEELNTLDKTSKIDAQKIGIEINVFREKLHSIIGPEGLLILPTHPRVAPTHHSPLLSPFDFIYTGIFNVLGNPATSVPIGLNSKGLPLSVQIVGPHFRDDLTLSAAEAIEMAFGGWVMPQ